MRSLLLASALVASTSFAGNLRNGDAREYHLKIKAPNGESHEPINTTETWEKTCNAFPCDIQNEDTGDTIRLTCAEENLDIKNGHFALNGAMSDVPAATPAAKPAKAGKHLAKKAGGKTHAKAATKKSKARHARRG